ncbi:hypothetical protein K458DRAFT_484035 [Lentithecium fluviatile CBS 122367]|uniref:Uncharacterized protein n=1 Tax=Lentithecium fluviatile CBS 122367 TaxID=1168545 RepID=A0A6G1JFP4_9PLEO|nr:hypothetical protein K458DRAFT_484035 [Lentithecium fluviatile CBS 122367]
MIEKKYDTINKHFRKWGTNEATAEDCFRGPWLANAREDDDGDDADDERFSSAAGPTRKKAVGDNMINHSKSTLPESPPRRPRSSITPPPTERPLRGAQSCQNPPSSPDQARDDRKGQKKLNDAVIAAAQRLDPNSVDALKRVLRPLLWEREQARKERERKLGEALKTPKAKYIVHAQPVPSIMTTPKARPIHTLFQEPPSGRTSDNQSVKKKGPLRFNLPPESPKTPLFKHIDLGGMQFDVFDPLAPPESLRPQDAAADAATPTKISLKTLQQDQVSLLLDASQTPPREDSHQNPDRSLFDTQANSPQSPTIEHIEHLDLNAAAGQDVAPQNTISDSQRRQLLALLNHPKTRRQTREDSGSPPGDGTEPLRVEPPAVQSQLLALLARPQTRCQGRGEPSSPADDGVETPRARSRAVQRIEHVDSGEAETDGESSPRSPKSPMARHSEPLDESKPLSLFGFFETAEASMCDLSGIETVESSPHSPESSIVQYSESVGESGPFHAISTSEPTEANVQRTATEGRRHSDFAKATAAPMPVPNFSRKLPASSTTDPLPPAPNSPTVRSVDLDESDKTLTPEYFVDSIAKPPAEEAHA